MNLYAVVLGGRAPGCHIELHDVVFAVGETFEETFPSLVRQWFGAPGQVHIDAWIELTSVDGHRIELRRAAPLEPRARLYFVNVGAYVPGKFAEQHEDLFVAAANADEAKAIAKRTACQGMDQVHRDTLHLVDDCIEVPGREGWYVHLISDVQAKTPPATSAYRTFPQEVVDQAVLR